MRCAPPAVGASLPSCGRLPRFVPTRPLCLPSPLCRRPRRFNSWDRQVFEWTGADGKPTSIKDFDRFQHNMIMGGYSADQAIDNDDVSGPAAVTRLPPRS